MSRLALLLWRACPRPRVYYDRVSKNGVEIYRINFSNNNTALVSLVMRQKHSATRAFDVDKVSRISYSLFHRCLFVLLVVRLLYIVFVCFNSCFWVLVVSVLYVRYVCVCVCVYILSTQQSYDFFLKKSSLFTKYC